MRMKHTTSAVVGLVCSVLVFWLGLAYGKFPLWSSRTLFLMSDSFCVCIPFLFLVGLGIISLISSASVSLKNIKVWCVNQAIACLPFLILCVVAGFAAYWGPIGSQTYPN